MEKLPTDDQSLSYGSFVCSVTHLVAFPLVVAFRKKDAIKNNSIQQIRLALLRYDTTNSSWNEDSHSFNQKYWRCQ